MENKSTKILLVVVSERKKCDAGKPSNNRKKLKSCRIKLIRHQEGEDGRL